MAGRFDERQRPSTIVGQWFGNGWSVPGPSATGGIGAPVATGTGYNYLQFNATGQLTVIYSGIYEVKSFGGGGAGWGGNGYNAFGTGGAKGGTGDLTVTLTPGTYTVVVGGGSTTGATAPTNYYPVGSGGASYLTGYTAVGQQGAGGANGGNTAGLDGAGAVGTQVNTFIGGSSLFKAAGGGNSRTGVGGSGIGGNGSNGSPGAATSAANNTASGGGGAGGNGQPNLQTGNGGSGGSGVVYVRWLG